jgi:hypothetical protein
MQDVSGQVDGEGSPDPIVIDLVEVDQVGAVEYRIGPQSLQLPDQQAGELTGLDVLLEQADPAHIVDAVVHPGARQGRLAGPWGADDEDERAAGVVRVGALWSRGSHEAQGKGRCGTHQRRETPSGRRALFRHGVDVSGGPFPSSPGAPTG